MATDYNRNTVTVVPDINKELEKIEEAFKDTLSRSGTEPNQMEAPLDFNSNRGINAQDPVNNQDVATKRYVDTVLADGGPVGGDKPASVRERITLQSGQVVVTFATVDAEQSVFYFSGRNGKRGRCLAVDDCTVDSPTQITLEESAPEGTLLVALQETA